MSWGLWGIGVPDEPWYRAASSPEGGWAPPVDEDGMVTLYHRTRPEYADSIIADQRFMPGRALQIDSGNTDWNPEEFNADEPVWFSTHPNGIDGLMGKSYEEWYGPAVVKVRVPVDKVNFTGPANVKPGGPMYASVHPQDLKGVPIVRHAHRTAADYPAHDPQHPYYFPNSDFVLGDDDAQEDLKTAWLTGDGLGRRKPHIQRGVTHGPSSGTGVEDWLQNLGHEFTKRIHAAEPTDGYTYRGMTVSPQWIDQAVKNRSVTLPLSSVDYDTEYPSHYINPNIRTDRYEDGARPNHGVFLRIDPGAKAHLLADTEYITHGDFDVHDVHLATDDETDTYDIEPGTTVMHIRQRSVPTPVGSPGPGERTAMSEYGGPRTVYRGIALRSSDFPVPHHQLTGQHVLDHIAGWMPKMYLKGEKPGLGGSWTLRRSLADEATHRTGYDLRAILTAEVDDDSIDHDATARNNSHFPSENEITVRRGHPVRVTGIDITPHGQVPQWRRLPFDPATRNAAHRTAMPWYHNTDAELNPGDMLLPAAERGYESPYLHADPDRGIIYHPDKVYFYHHHGEPTQEQLKDIEGPYSGTMGFGRNTYQVKPEGHIERDPEWQTNWDMWGDLYDDKDEVPGARDYMAPRARVVRKIEPVSEPDSVWGSKGYQHYYRPELGRPKKYRTKKARTMTAAVTVYTQPNCVQCTMTKKQLDKLGIEHNTVDVSADPEAHAYVTGLGYTAAPVVVVNDGEDHWAGFKPDRLKALSGE